MKDPNGLTDYPSDSPGWQQEYWGAQYQTINGQTWISDLTLQSPTAASGGVYGTTYTYSPGGLLDDGGGPHPWITASSSPSQITPYTLSFCRLHTRGPPRGRHSLMERSWDSRSIIRWTCIR
jgi:hypothetical protein